MWATLAIASALSLAPAQAGKLEIKNDRITYGILGQERKETKLLAGDVFIVTFDIEGLQVKDDGRVRYSMGMELLNNKTGKAEFTKEPQELAAAGLPFRNDAGVLDPALPRAKLAKQNSPSTAVPVGPGDNSLAGLLVFAVGGDGFFSFGVHASDSLLRKTSADFRVF